MTRVSGLWAVAVVVTGWSLVAGGCSALTECGGDGDCEANYRCDATAKRCVASCGTDAECDVGQRCNAGLCEGGAGSSSGGGASSSSSGGSTSGSSLFVSSSAMVSSSRAGSSSRAASSSSLAGSSSSSGVVASSSRAGSSSLPGSSSAAPSSSAGSSSSAGNGAWDSCNGDDDDGDGRTDEDRWLVLMTLDMPPMTSDGSYISRVAVAPSDSGFFVAYSAFCSGSSSEVFVNHIAFDGTLAQMAGDCSAVRGVRASNSGSLPSRQPALAAEGGRRAGLVWAEATGAAGADLNLAEVTLEQAGTLRVSAPLRVSRVYSFYPQNNPEGHNAYGDVALLGTDGFFTVLTDGTNVDNEHAHIRLVQPGGGGALEVTGSGVDLGRSNFGEAAVARVGSNHAVAWSLEANPSPRQTFIQFFNSTQQPLRAQPAALESGFEINLMAMEGNELGMTYAMEAAGANLEVHAVTLTVAGNPALAGNPFTVPNTQGQYGSAYAGDGELLMVVADSVDNKTRLHQVDIRNGARCGSLVVYNSNDGVAAAAAVSGEYLLVLVRHGPNNDPADSSRVDAHILRRQRG